MVTEKAALSPAQVSEIKLDKENLKAQVIVEDDQLSLAIGKHGQNVRLASRIIGWDLDIRSKSTLAKAAEEEKAKALQEEKVSAKPVKEKKPKKEKKAKEGVAPLEELSGVGEKTLAGLKEAGFNSAQDIAGASAADLTKVKGIGEKKAEKLIEQARKLVKK